ncbi:MAG: hypothetical protein PHV93_00680 [Candidatus Pacebacteria bacterium]|nr:hypothetical protein [Candidatus Paceibacterota bacterium]
METRTDRTELLELLLKEHLTPEEEAKLAQNEGVANGLVDTMRGRLVSFGLRPKNGEKDPRCWAQ